MMKKYILGTFAIMLAGSAVAGEAKVTWQNPDSYTDVRPSNQTKAGFEARVFKSLDEVFDKLAKQLPDGYSLLVTVTDLDLAGDVRPGRGPGGQDIRIVRDIDWPRMSFSYVLNNPQGQQVTAGKEDLKDINFRSGISINTSDSFYYEENMLKNWFNKQQEKKVFPAK
ncbi:DUF3016 domain-containing protein [Undibacterium sp. TJN25]|uniref:DUF3016 domain-containing protein n=1 Tax=Undibacterium sp. TJN25 TaxID=3413056 RepID=UPI003BF42609